MELRVSPYIILRTGTFAAVSAPIDDIVAFFAGRPELKRYLVLYISGNGSRLLTRVGDRTATFDVRRAFTAHQLLTILRDAGHTIVFIEHDPTLFADAGGGVLAAVGQTMAECAAGSIVILYTPVPDRSFGVLAGYAGQIITMGESQQKDAERRTGSRGGHERRKASDQATLEVF